MAETTRNDAWGQVELEARAEVLARAELPPGFGHRVAWVLCAYGKTDGVSDVHRVEQITEDGMTTFCGAAIPDVRLHIPPLRSLDTCMTCEIALAKSRELSARATA